MSQLNGQSESSYSQASRLRAQRDEARSNIIRIQNKAEADLEQKKDQISELEHQLGKLRQTVKIQSDQIQGPRETNTPRHGVNYLQSTVYNQPPPPYQTPIVPRAGQVHTRPDMLGSTPPRIPSSHTSRHNVVPPERPQLVVSANTATVGASGFHNKWLLPPLQLPNAFHTNDGVLIPPSQGQNLLPCSAPKVPCQNAILGPPPYSQHPNP